MSNPNQSPKPTFTNEEFQDYNNSSFDGYVGDLPKFFRGHLPGEDGTVPAPELREVIKTNEDENKVRTTREGVAIGKTYDDEQGNQTVLVEWNDLPAGGTFPQRLGKVGMFLTEFVDDKKR